MNANLLNVLKQITAQYGEEVLEDPRRLRALFSDLAKDEPKPLHMAFGRCIEAGAYAALQNTEDAAERASRKTAIVQRLRDEHGLDPVISAAALDILEAAIFETASVAQQTQPAPDTLAPAGMIRKRGLAGLIVLSIITFGIYGLYWIYRLAKDVNAMCEGDGKKPAVYYAIFS